MKPKSGQTLLKEYSRGQKSGGRVYVRKDLHHRLPGESGTFGTFEILGRGYLLWCSTDTFSDVLQTTDHEGCLL